MELQEMLSHKGIQFANAVRFEDWQAMGYSPGRRYPKTARNIRVTILHSIQENLYKESPEDWDYHPVEETTTTGTSRSRNEVGEVRT